MQSVKSYSKWTIFKKTAGRFSPIWITYLIIWVVMLPLNGLIQLQQSGTSLEQFASNTVAGMGSSTLTLSVIFGVMAAMAVFSYLYSSRSANFYGALPVRREWLFSIQYLGGLAFLIIPNLVVFGLTLLVELAGGAVEMGPLLFWLGTACGEGFFFYTMAVLIAMLVGHILAVPAFFAIGNGIVLSVYFIVQAVLSEFYYGFPTVREINEAVRWLTPVAQLGKVSAETVGTTQADGTVQWIFHAYGMNYVAAYAGAAVVMAVIAFLLYRVRQLESAGDLVAAKPLRPVFKYGVALCGGLALGYLTSQILGGSKVVLVLATLFWGVVGCFVAQMMLDKSFKVFKKWKGPAAVAGVFLLLFLVVQFDFTGYEKRVPDPADVASVQVIDLINPVAAGSSRDVDLEITDQAQIANVITLHRWALEHQQEYENGMEYEGIPVYIPLNLTYTLNSGATISRSYRLAIDPADMDREGTAAWALEQLYADRDLYWKAYGFDKIHSILEDGGRLEAVYNDGATDQSFYDEEAIGLLEAVEEDFWAGTIGRPSLANYLNEKWSPSRSLHFYAASGRDQNELDYQYATVDFWVPDTAVNTLQVLTEQGIDFGNQGSTPGVDNPDNSEDPNGGEVGVRPATDPDDPEPVVSDNIIDIWIDNPNAFQEDE